jgi:hypothetical protein
MKAFSKTGKVSSQLSSIISNDSFSLLDLTFSFRVAYAKFPGCKEELLYPRTGASIAVARDAIRLI